MNDQYDGPLYSEEEEGEVELNPEPQYPIGYEPPLDNPEPEYPDPEDPPYVEPEPPIEIDDGKVNAFGTIWKLYFQGNDDSIPTEAQVALATGAVKAQQITETAGMARVTPSIPTVQEGE